VLTLKEIKEIDQFASTLEEEEEREEEIATVLAPDIGENCLFYKGFYMSKRVPRRRAKGNISFTPGAPSKGRCAP